MTGSSSRRARTERWRQMAANRRTAGLRLKVAAFRIAGMTHKAAAEAAGASKRSVERWEGIPGDAEYWGYWNDAHRHLKKTTYPEAFLTLRQGLRSERDSDKIAAAKFLVTLIEGEPTQRHEHTGKDGRPMQVEDVTLADILAGKKERVLTGATEPDETD